MRRGRLIKSKVARIVFADNRELDALAWKTIKQVKQEMSNVGINFDKDFKVITSEWDLMEGKIAGYDPEKGIMYIKPKAFENLEYLRHVIAHEMIHVHLGRGCDGDPHDDEFIEMAEVIGIPEKYQD
jgi:predicted SprT family Zn-dependent metalloprotease